MDNEPKHIAKEFLKTKRPYSEWREGHKLCGGVQRHIAKSGVTAPTLIHLTVLPRVVLHVTKKLPNLVTLAINVL